MTGEFLLFRLVRKILAAWECTRYGLTRPPTDQKFTIVSCERHAGDFAIRCLDSVNAQRYDKGLVRHLFIDDASEDGTFDRIVAWLQQHPDNRVELVRREKRCGGTANTLEGIRMAHADSIVIELNGDDWLPDAGVLDFYNRVYMDDHVWMTYNSFRNSGGPPSANAREYPDSVVAGNAFRDQEGWQASHLHTFRKRLFNHLDETVFIDPETGRYWECADDQALYLGLLELAGRHSRHIHRITCIYNFWEASHSHVDASGSIAVAARIRQGKRFQPLSGL